MSGSAGVHGEDDLPLSLPLKIMAAVLLLSSVLLALFEEYDNEVVAELAADGEEGEEEEEEDEDLLLLEGEEEADEEENTWSSLPVIGSILPTDGKEHVASHQNVHSGTFAGLKMGRSRERRRRAMIKRRRELEFNKMDAPREPSWQKDMLQLLHDSWHEFKY